MPDIYEMLYENLFMRRQNRQIRGGTVPKDISAENK